MIKLIILKCQGTNEEKDYIVDASISSDNHICKQGIKYLHDMLKKEEDIDVSRFFFDCGSLIIKDIQFTTLCLTLAVIESEMEDTVVLDASNVFFKEDLERIAAFYYKIIGGTDYAS